MRKKIAWESYMIVNKDWPYMWYKVSGCLEDLEAEKLDTQEVIPITIIKGHNRKIR